MPLANLPYHDLTGPLVRGVGEGGGVSAFRPSNLFAGVSKGIALDLSDKTTLYQDSARTTRVSAAGDPIGSPSDISGNGAHPTQATTASKPLWQTTYAALDGVDDSWVSPSIDFSGTNKITVVVGLRKNSDTLGFIAELSADAGLNSGFYMATEASSAGYRIACGTPFAAIKTGATTFAAPHLGVVSGLWDKAAGTSAVSDMGIRVNGVDQPEAVIIEGDATGTFANAPVYIGRRNQSQFPLDGRIYRLIIIGRTLTASERAQAERWCTTPTGVTLP